MKKNIIITIIVLVIIGFFIFNKKDEPVVVTPVPEVPVEDTKPIVQTPTTPAPTSNYSYSNDEFKFAVKLPGLVATQKPTVPLSFFAIFTFGVGDQSAIEEQKRVPNTMAVYIWSNESDFNQMTATGTALADETINGITFKVYSFTEEDTTSYHYTVKKDGAIYDIGVRKKSDISKFYFI